MKPKISPEARRMLRHQRIEEQAKRYIPAPPGVTYWERVTVTTPAGQREIYSPITRPLAACAANLEDDDVLALLRRLTVVAAQRGIPA